MPCHPYNLLNGRSIRRIAPALGLLLLCTLPSKAQWYCPPVWQPAPPQYVNPYPTWYGPGTTSWTTPAPHVAGGQTIITAYGPVEEQPAAPTDAADVLRDVPGVLRVIVPEAFLNRLLARNDYDAGPVTDVILGANVTGNQNTQTTLTIDVEPSADTARLQFQLDGTTFNETVGVTPQAAVRSRGTHQFRVTKQVDFDGLQLTTRSPAAWVTPQLTNEGAATSFSGVPVLGPIASQIAMTQAERRRPLVEQIITQRVTEQVAPRLNGDVDQRLTDANLQLQQQIPRYLAWAGLSPQDLSLTSTDDRILFGLCVPSSPALPGSPTPQLEPSGAAKVPHESDGPLLPAPTSDPSIDLGPSIELGPSSEPDAAPEPESEPAPTDDDGFTIIRQISHRLISPTETTRTADSSSGVAPRAMLPVPSGIQGSALTLAMHEEFVNHLLRRLPVHGAEVSDRTIDRSIESIIDSLTSSQFRLPDAGELGAEPAEIATIVLSRQSPLSVRFDGGEFRLIAAAGFRPRMGPEVPPQQIEIPFTVTHQSGEWLLVPGTVSVAALPGADEQPMEKLARPIIQQQITERLQSVRLPELLPWQLPGTSPGSLSVREVTLADGWLLIAVD